jgi:hypothetical protein
MVVQKYKKNYGLRQEVMDESVIAFEYALEPLTGK